ncbi:MAG: hypothetical protein AB8C95_02945, partial [Phycisphaeraceae bacterium]
MNYLRLLSAFTILLALALPTYPQALVRGEHQVDVPAIGEGLWVSNTFQSNMVLQRDKPIFIWGWADAGARVIVSFAGHAAVVTADKDRYWKATLPAQPANAKPKSMTIEGKGKTLTLDNILIGDVWVMGGQSNMEHPIRAVENGGLEIISANHPNMRILTIPQGNLTNEVAGFPRLMEWHGFFNRHFRKGYWDECSPETV